MVAAVFMLGEEECIISLPHGTTVLEKIDGTRKHYCGITTRLGTHTCNTTHTHTHKGGSNISLPPYQYTAVEANHSKQLLYGLHQQQ